MENKKFIGSLESLRGIAALFVAFGHTLSAFVIQNYGASIFDISSCRGFFGQFFRFIFNGDSAVLMFFVLSGFVLAKSLDKEVGLSLRLYIKFLLRRCFRIFPVHIFVTIFIIIVNVLYITPFPLNIPNTQEDLLAGRDFFKWLDSVQFNNLSISIILKNLSLKDYCFNGVCWTLQVEIIASFFIPIMHYLSRKKDFFLDSIVLVVLAYITKQAFGRFYTDFLFSFYVGMMILSWKEYYFFYMRKFNVSPLTIFILSYLFLALPLIVTNGRTPYSIYVESISSASIILLLINEKISLKKITNFLSHKLLRLMGKLSYSFYLVHYTVLIIVARLFYGNFNLVFLRKYEFFIFAIACIVTGLISLGIAQVLYTFIEKPFIKIGKRITKW